MHGFSWRGERVDGEGKEGTQWGRDAAAQRQCEGRGGLNLFDIKAPACLGDVLLPLVVGRSRPESSGRRDQYMLGRRANTTPRYTIERNFHGVTARHLVKLYVDLPCS